MDNDETDVRKEMPSRGFAKLDVGIVDSTLWMKPHDALRVWIALLAKCDSFGIVRASAPSMAHLCFVTLERFEEIVNEFASPDEHSRTPDHGGRRLRKIDGGWLILNYLLYRDMMQRKAQSHAERQANYRERVKKRDASVTGRVTGDTEAEAEEEVEAEVESEKGKGSLSLPDSLNTDGFRSAWEEWTSYRRERKIATLKPRSVAAKWAELAEVGSDAAIAAIRNSIANGWQGIFPNKTATATKAGGPCNRCSGKGYIEHPDAQGGWTMVKEPCKRCQGTGRY